VKDRGAYFPSCVTEFFFWTQSMPTFTRFVHNAARWLDRQPLPLVVAGGVVLGLGIGLPGFFYLQSPVWMLFWGALFLMLWRLGHTAEPVFEEDNPVAAQPQRVRDGLLVMMDLPGGRFLMGSPDADNMAHDSEKPQHEVTVSGFRIAVTPVTAGLYCEVMKAETLPEEQAQLPAVEVSWYDAVEFCNRLSERQGYRPCYRQKFGRWICDWHADGYRLPTEAEWEYACRAGTTTWYAFGDDPARLQHYAWFSENSSLRAHEVARKRPNLWGLYDMHGNVWEWCWDWYGPYAVQSAKDPRGPKKPAPGSEYRVVRGGSFGFSPEFLRSAFRVCVHPGHGGRLSGFRCVRVPPQLVD
jgi:formylglycine-generating enzyme required for sulfatase activity